MRKSINFCENCGDKYIWQGSGQYSLETPEKYNDNKYCPHCKQLIVDVLNTVEKKTELRYIPTNDYTLDELLKLSSENKLNERKCLKDFPLSLPVCRRVFSSLYSRENNEHSLTEELKINNVSYIFSYWQKSKKVISITKQVRWNLLKNEEYI